nr:MAG TPA: hypothetical protein [Caudoviricetes sp.]DAV23063.1 MAG TPA: hypothetical protein [Caudoviricetes sp.]
MSVIDTNISDISFNEKITNLKLRHLEGNQLLTLVSSLEEFPASLPLVAEIDLFNIKADHKYQIQVLSIGESQLDEQLIHVTNVFIPREEFVIYKENYGFTSGNFSFNLTAKKGGDYRISFRFYDVKLQKVLDEIHQYIYLNKEAPKDAR